MNFAEPLWLLAGLVACGALAWAWRRHDARQRVALATFASTHFSASLSSRRQSWKRGLFLAAVVGLFAALARPQAGFKWEEIKRRGIEVIFAVDTSRSMLTPDVKPDRLTRAKLAVDDFASHLDGDGVGLIAFAGNAFLQCPITLDYDAFHESLAALDTTIIPRGGTDLASAIQEAQAALQNRPGKDKILILLTDGEDLEGRALAAAKSAAQKGLKIYTVGVGTANGDLIPLSADQGGSFVKDDAGQFVKSRLDEAGLKAIAESTGGFYVPLGNQGQGLDTLYQQALAPLTKHDLASRRQKIYTERFQWPLAASLGLLLASMLISTRRRATLKTAATAAKITRPSLVAQGAAAAATLLCLIPLPQAKASPATAEAAYQKGDFSKAQRDYAVAAQGDPKTPELQFNAGTAAYKAGDFPQATASFQKSLGGNPSADPKRLATQEDAYYDLGNTLYRSGQKTVSASPQDSIKTWEQAVKMYDAAIHLNANDADAKYNRDLVQHKLDELKQKQKQEQPPQNQNQAQNQNQKNQDQSNQPRDNPDQKNTPNKDQKSAQENPSTQNSEAKKEENEDQKSASKPKSEASENQPSATGGSKPDQPAKSEQAGQPTNPAQGQPPANPQTGSSADQKQGVDAPREPGQMTKDEARALLDSMKDEQQRLPTAPVARNGSKAPSTESPLKDW